MANKVKNILWLILILLFFIPSNSVLAEGEIWTQLNPDTNPEGRSSHAMTYIGDDKVMLFGGRTGYSVVNDTWIFDLSENTWTLMDPTLKPPARDDHAMAYIGDDKVLLYGGSPSDPFKTLFDTWIYDLSENTWTLMDPGPNSSATKGVGLAKIDEGKILLFGGLIPGLGGYDETWIYDVNLNNWTQMFPETKPPGRNFLGMAHIGGDKAMIFGGNIDYIFLYDTWVYDLSENNWEVKYPHSATVVDGRVDPELVNLGADHILLFGGMGGDIYNMTVPDETWILDFKQNRWIETNKVPPKPSGGLIAMAHIGNNNALLFGSGINDDETWLFTTQFPDLQVTKSNDTFGKGSVGTIFNWKTTITNNGKNNAVFMDDQIIFRDDLTTGPTYSSVKAQNFSNITNSENIDCYLATRNISDTSVECVVNGDMVTIGALSGSFDVVFSVTPNTAGELENPSIAGRCQVDFDLRIDETDETNNDCSDTLSITEGDGSGDSDSVTDLPETGFAQGLQTMLDIQPSELAYSETTDIWLEIPKLGVEASIVGVPKVFGEWDVKWLGNNAGWLEGTAFPTWSGNTVITAHVWDVYDNPGIFADLKTLEYGDQIGIRFGQANYIYQVVDNFQVYSDDLSILNHENSDIVTLLTCEGYIESMGGYKFRRVVKAVLVDIR